MYVCAGPTVSRCRRVRFQDAEGPRRYGEVRPDAGSLYLTTSVDPQVSKGALLPMKTELIHASRFVSWHRLPAVALLFATCALIVYGLFAGIDIVDRTADLDSDRTDAALYVAVAARVADGENYYRAAATEHRERGYPLRPFVTVREPALAYVTAVVGGPDRMNTCPWRPCRRAKCNPMTDFARCRENGR